MSLSSLNGMEFIGAHLKFKVQGFKEKIDGFVYYQILVTFTLTEPFKRQDLSFTYQQCLSLCQTLQAQCPDIPILPSPSMFEFKPAAQDIEKKRIELEKWLMAIVWRCDIIGTKDFQEFCNMHNLIDESWLESPIPSIDLHQGHAFGVVDFYYDPNTQVCFVATSDESFISKVQGFVSLLTKGLTETEGPTKSQIICYRLDVDQDGEPQTRKLWMNTYVNKINTITWDEQLTILAIGFDTGQICVLRINPEKDYKDCSEVCQFIKHTDAVTGLAANSLEGQLYSISKDRCLITTDLTNSNKILKEKEFPYELTCMLQQKENKRLFVGDTGGSVYIFHYHDGPLQAAHQIKPNLKMSITTLQFHQQKNFLIVGSKEGLVIVFELGRPGKENNSTLITQIKSVPNQKSVLFSVSTKELYINYNNNILVVDSTKVKILYSLGAHKGAITKLEMFEDLGLLISGGRDGSVKFWQYKYFPHTQINTDLALFRGDLQQTEQKQKEEEDEKQNQKLQRQNKPQLEDLDDWSHE